jgi:hypothetical protein
LTFFSDEAWFHLQGFINTQNNRYRSFQNSHVSHKVLFHPVEVGVWCAVSARKIVESLLFHETVNSERWLQVILGQFFLELTEEERLAGFSKIQLLPTVHVCLCRLCQMFLGTEVSAVVLATTFIQS